MTTGVVRAGHGTVGHGTVASSWDFQLPERNGWCDGCVCTSFVQALGALGL